MRNAVEERGKCVVCIIQYGDSLIMSFSVRCYCELPDAMDFAVVVLTLLSLY